jgi:hypothetical protein
MKTTPSSETLADLLAYIVAAYRGAQSADPGVAARNALELRDTIAEAAERLALTGALDGFRHSGQLAIHHEDGTLTAG